MADLRHRASELQGALDEARSGAAGHLSALNDQHFRVLVALRDLVEGVADAVADLQERVLTLEGLAAHAAAIEDQDRGAGD